MVTARVSSASSPAAVALDPGSAGVFAGLGVSDDEHAASPRDRVATSAATRAGRRFMGVLNSPLNRG